MQLTDRGLETPTQPNPSPARAPRPPIHSSYRWVGQEPPRSQLELLSVLFRIDGTPAFLAPPVVGAMLGWWQTGDFNWGLLAILIISTLAAVWGSATLHEYFDYRRSLYANGHAIHEPFSTGLGYIQSGHLRPQVAVNLGLILFGIAGVCALWLGVLGGWPVLFFACFALVMALSAAAAPLLKVTYLAWAFVEISRYVAFGFLPVLTGYYTQSPTLYLLPLSVGLGFAFLVAAVLFAQRIIHQRRDWLLQKRTISVILGPARSMDVCVVFTLCGFIALLMGASLTALPLWTLLTLVALPVALRRFAYMRREELTVADSILLYESAISATTITGILFIAALLIDGLL